MGNDETPRWPFFNNNRAWGGVVGANGFLVVSKTATFILKVESFDSGVTLLSSNVRLDNDHLRFVCLRHWFRVSRLFNRKPQSLGLAEQIASQGDYCCIRKDRSSSL